MENQTTEQSRGWGDKLHDLFSTKKPKDAVVPSAQNQNNPESRRQGETYEQWGTRICGIVSGSLVALPPYLHKVYNYIYESTPKTPSF